MTKFKGLLQGLATASIASIALTATAEAQQPTSCPTIEIAGVARPGVDATRFFPGPTSEKVMVEKASLVTARDVVEADTSYAEGAWGLGLHFSPEAAARMRSYTTAHVGDRLAVIVQGQAKMVVKILDPNLGDAIWISPFAKPEGDALAAKINDCAKPAR